ncbi:MAG: pilin [Pseudomonadota bacterium]|nr:pilin [Pseudomonadota bacterium]
MTRATHGLTLVEFAIALGLAVFLFAIGIPAYQGRVTREVVAEVIDLARPAKALVEEYAIQHGQLPRTDDLALPFVTSKYVAGTAWTGTPMAGAITVSTRASSGGDDALADKVIVLSASYDGRAHRVDWVCAGTGATTVPGRFLPTGCGTP